MKGFNLWNLATSKSVISEEKRGVGVVYVTPKNSKYFIGYVDGVLESRDPTNLSLVQSIHLKSRILSIISDNTTVYVGMRNGRIISLPVNNLDESKMKVIKKMDKKTPISLLKLSKDNTFLLGYVNVDNNETFHVFNIVKNEKAWFGKLDLAAAENREDPEKLIVISDNCLNVFARGENNKGVCMYSMFDGSIVTNMNAMHTNYILQILVT